MRNRGFQEYALDVFGTGLFFLSDTHLYLEYVGVDEESSSCMCLLISCFPSFSPDTTSFSFSILFFRLHAFTSPSILTHTHTLMLFTPTWVFLSFQQFHTQHLWRIDDDHRKSFQLHYYSNVLERHHFYSPELHLFESTELQQKL